MNNLKIKIGLNKIFPFYILFDRTLKIHSIGESLSKIIQIKKNDNFADHFVIKRPHTIINSFQDLLLLNNQMVAIEILSSHNLTLRGQLEYLEEDDLFVYLGTPWIGSMDQVKKLSLTIKDFALHDPMIDLLHVLKTQEIANDEIKQLLGKVNDQKNKLRTSESNYRIIVENASDIIYKVNSDGIFTFVNEVAERITGYSKEELVKMHYSELMREDFRKKAFDLYRGQIKNKISTTYFEFPLISKYGKEIWMGQSVQFPQTNDTIIELTALAIDITTRKIAELNLKVQEEKYRNIIANMNLGLLEVRNDDVIQYANQSFCNMSGFSLYELIGQKASELFLNEDEKKEVKQHNNLRKDGISDMYSVKAKNKKGEARYWVISGAPRYNDKGELVGSVGIHLDVTEQKKLERELKIAKVKAEESSKAKESFLATMSHELRTPLNAIVGISELMQMDAKARNKENLDILTFSSKTLLALISDILDLSKIESGKIEFSNNPIDLRELLNGIYQMFRAICEEKKLELIFNIDPNLPQYIYGDELRLSQILNNLISNAVKFTSKGYVKLSLNVDLLNKDQVNIKFNVSDSGIGIKKSSLKSIFNDFEQADKDIVRKYGGTGLGLSITKKLVDLYGGKIAVESKVNRGTDFLIDIDFKICNNKSHQPNETSNKETEQTINSINKKVLLVEDNLANQKVAVSYLHHWGLKCEIANNGKEALELLSQNTYDIALIDLFMPVMDGFETIENIRKTKSLQKFPIIALTASAETSLMKKALSKGANKCLTKPFNAQELQKTINQLIISNSSTRSRKEVKKDDIESDLRFKFIDLKKIEEASLGSNKFILEMLSILSKEIPVIMEDADHYLSQHQYALFSTTIHKLKNNLLMLGIEILRDDLCFLEENAQTEKDSLEILSKFKHMKNVWSKAAVELKEAKKRMQ